MRPTAPAFSPALQKTAMYSAGPMLIMCSLVAIGAFVGSLFLLLAAIDGRKEAEEDDSSCEASGSNDCSGLELGLTAMGLVVASLVFIIGIAALGFGVTLLAMGIGVLVSSCSAMANRNTDNMTICGGWMDVAEMFGLKDDCVIDLVVSPDWSAHPATDAPGSLLHLGDHGDQVSTCCSCCECASASQQSSAAQPAVLISRSPPSGSDGLSPFLKDDKLVKIGDYNLSDWAKLTDADFSLSRVGNLLSGIRPPPPRRSAGGARPAPLDTDPTVLRPMIHCQVRRKKLLDQQLFPRLNINIDARTCEVLVPQSDDGDGGAQGADVESPEQNAINAGAGTGAGAVAGHGRGETSATQAAPDVPKLQLVEVEIPRLVRPASWTATFVSSGRLDLDLGSLGIAFHVNPLVVTYVAPDSPAAGLLQAGDYVVKVITYSSLPNVSGAGSGPTTVLHNHAFVGIDAIKRAFSPRLNPVTHDSGLSISARRTAQHDLMKVLVVRGLHGHLPIQLSPPRDRYQAEHAHADSDVLEMGEAASASGQASPALLENGGRQLQARPRSAVDIV